MLSTSWGCESWYKFLVLLPWDEFVYRNWSSVGSVLNPLPPCSGDPIIAVGAEEFHTTGCHWIVSFKRYHPLLSLFILMLSESTFKLASVFLWPVLLIFWTLPYLLAHTQIFQELLFLSPPQSWKQTFFQIALVFFWRRTVFGNQDLSSQILFLSLGLKSIHGLWEILKDSCSA